MWLKLCVSCLCVCLCLGRKWKVMGSQSHRDPGSKCTWSLISKLFLESRGMKLSQSDFLNSVKCPVFKCQTCTSTAWFHCMMVSFSFDRKAWTTLLLTGLRSWLFLTFSARPIKTCHIIMVTRILSSCRCYRSYLLFRFWMTQTNHSQNQFSGFLNTPFISFNIPLPLSLHTHLGPAHSALHMERVTDKWWLPHHF